MLEVNRRLKFRRAPELLTFTVILATASASMAENSGLELKLTQASSPDAFVTLLSAPHTGKPICEIADQTPIRFLRRANHGPHKFAEVEIKEGACAGKTGFIAWSSLKPIN